MKTDATNGGLGESIQELIGRNVVLDTQGPILYLGRLTEVHDTGLWLEDADVHDCTEGHASKELYVIESVRYGIRTNRRRAFVLRAFVMSISAIDDIVSEATGDKELWPS